MNTFRYFLPEHGGDAENSKEFESLCTNLDRLDVIAENAAYDYHSSGGYDASWPIELVLLDSNYKVLGTFEIEREAVPEFSAKRKDA